MRTPRKVIQVLSELKQKIHTPGKKVWNSSVLYPTLQHPAPPSSCQLSPFLVSAMGCGERSVSFSGILDRQAIAGTSLEFLYTRWQNHGRVKGDVCSLESFQYRLVNATFGPVSNKEERGNNELILIQNHLGARNNVTQNSHLTAREVLNFQLQMRSYQEFKDFMCLSSAVSKVLLIGGA